MATAPEITSPPSMTSPAKKISQADLSRELAPKPEPAVFSEPGKGTTRIGGEPGKVEENEIPSFGKAAREMMAKKAAEGDAPPAETKVAAEQTLKGERVPPSSERKAAVVSEPAKETKAVVAETKTDEDPPEEERRVLPHDKPATAKRISYFLRNEATLKTQLAEAKKELDAAKKAPATAANTEEVSRLKEEHQKAQDELGRFRRRYDLDNDPTFKAKYDEPAAGIESSIEATLKRISFGDATLKAIKDEGGFGAFSRSGKQYTVQEEVDGALKPVQRTGAELARQWLNTMNVDDAEFIKAGIGRQRLLTEERRTAIEKESADFKKWDETQRAAGAQSTVQQQEKLKQDAAAYEAWHKSTLEGTDWLKDAEVPDNATEEQRAAVTERNEFTAQLRAGLTKHPKDFKEYSAMLLDAQHAHHLRREVGSRDERIKSLEAQLAKAQAAHRTTPKSGSLLTGGAPKAQEAEDKNADPTDLTKALRRGRDKIIGGSSDE